MLEALGRVYSHDAQVRQQTLSAQERLRFHQQHSVPVMEELHGWLQAQVAQKNTEPNSALGKAINYMLRHWRGLTVFLRQAGAPLDNNLCEQVLKRAVLHRKNALFYRTLKGAEVGDLFMSLIHTCELGGAIRSTTSPNCSSTPRVWPTVLASGCRGTIGRRLSKPPPHDHFCLTRLRATGKMTAAGSGCICIRCNPGGKAMKRLKKDLVREARIHNEAIVDASGPEERAMGWYYYLEDRLRFPFEARCIVAKVISRSAKVKPSASSAWYPKMRAAPTSS